LLYFYDILSVCTHQGTFKFLVLSLLGEKQPRYKHFPAVGVIFNRPYRRNSGSDQKKLGGAKTGRTSSIAMPSMVEIVGRALAVDQKV